MPRNDGIKYGSGGTIMEILEPTPVKKKETKKVEILEERIHDALPSEVDLEVEPGDEE